MRLTNVSVESGEAHNPGLRLETGEGILRCSHSLERIDASIKSWKSGKSAMSVEYSTGKGRPLDEIAALACQRRFADRLSAHEVKAVNDLR